MSRWLKSVNNLLETLDGQVEDVVDDAAAFHDLRGRVQDEFDDDDYDSDDDESEYESEGLESEFEEEEVVVWEEPEERQEPLFRTEAEPFEETVADEAEPEQTKTPAASEQNETQTAPPLPLVPVSETAVHVHDDSVKGTAAAVADVDPAVSLKGVAKPPPPLTPAEIHSDCAIKTLEPEATADQAAKPPSQPPAPPLPVEKCQTKEEIPVNVSKPKPPPPPPKPVTKTVAQEPARLPVIASDKVPKHAPKSMSGLLTSKVESPPASGYASAPNATTSQGNTSSIQQQLKRSNRELKKVQSEARQLRKHVMQLNAQLETAEAEMAAQREELQRAAERMEKDRTRNNEEREDLMDEHDEELEHLKEHYEKLLAEQKEHYEAEAEELQDRLAIEEEKRMQEGGDWTKELEDSIQREREALKRLGETKEENAALQAKTAKLEAQQNALQKKLESSAQNFQTASQREREAEDKLDAALSLHSRQLSQRQAREAELERMVADLGAALTVARQKEQNRSSNDTGKSTQGDAGYRKKYEMAVDELETVKVQLSMELQRCEALREELNDITRERTEETLESQARQQQHDREIADLTANLARLQASLREREKRPSAPGETTGETNLSDVLNACQSKEVEELKDKVASLSEQLIRLQEKNDRSKSEMLALKNRLQASNARAEKAEKALAAAPPATTSQMYQAEAGGATYGSGMRRRIKGGRGRNNPASVRSIRSALNMQPGRVGEGTEQLAATLDAVDSFLVETGSFMRHEPLARLAFLMYLVVLHLWAFCLVLFHAHSFEKEHGDFGSLSETGGLPGEGVHP